MTKCRALQNRIETRTGFIWGAYALPETFMAMGDRPQPLLHVMLHGRDEGLVRIEGGIRRRGFYLSWGER